jgi:hypothetical protein
MPIVVRVAIVATLVGSSAGPAFAYVGPGAGLGLLGAFWALLTAVVSSLAFLVIWPLRNALRRRKAADGRRRKAAGRER